MRKHKPEIVIETRPSELTKMRNSTLLVAPQLPTTRKLRTMGARDLFKLLRPHLLNSRPVVAVRKEVYGKDSAGRKRYHSTPVFGAPTFRNVIDPKNGRIVGAE